MKVQIYDYFSIYTHLVDKKSYIRLSVSLLWGAFRWPFALVFGLGAPGWRLFSPLSAPWSLPVRQASGRHQLGIRQASTRHPLCIMSACKRGGCMEWGGCKALWNSLIWLFWGLPGRLRRGRNGTERGRRGPDGGLGRGKKRTEEAESDDVNRWNIDGCKN